MKSRINKAWLWVLAGMVVGSTWAPRAHAKMNLDPDQPTTAELSNPVTYDVDYKVIFTPPYKSNDVRVWLPVPQDTPGQKIEGFRVTPTPISDGREPIYGNRLAFFDYAKPSGAQMIEERYKATVYEMRWNLDPTKVVRIRKWPNSFGKYLRSEDKIVVDQATIQLARQIVGDEKNPALQHRKIMRWVIDNLTYGHGEFCSLQADTKRTLERKTGHCSDYHGLTTALSRAVGIPARLSYGQNPVEKKLASPSHCKNEVYLAPYGWVQFDVSEAQKQIRAAEKNPALKPDEAAKVREETLARLFSGFRDNTWLRMTIGTNYQFVPAVAEGLPPLVRTAYIEADGKVLKDPDPADPKATAFSWMILAQWNPNKPLTYPWKY